MTEQPTSSVPERPRYALAGTAPQWRDLEGYYTRFGDVRDLLRAVDDRYVIMNAGDELRLRFPEAPPPARGLVRDFIVIGDGWVKDGDYNTSFSRTVLPLPTHRTGRYDAPPRQLEDDPVYRRHAGDFAEYHTRYVTPDTLRDALRRGPPPRHPETGMKRYARAALAVIFVGLLLTPFLIRRFGRPVSAPASRRRGERR